MNDKHYLNEMPFEKALALIKSSDSLMGEYWEHQSVINSEQASDTWKWILKGDGWEDIKVDSCSYTWWANIRPGHYGVILNIDDYDYFSEEDAKELKRLQAKVKKIKDKVENLEDCDGYYDKINEWEDEADELADKALQIVVNMVKEMEDVTMEQVEDFIRQEYDDGWLKQYIVNNDTNQVYEDYTKTYRTNYKGDK